MVFSPESAGDLASHGSDSFLVSLAKRHSSACKHPVEDQMLDFMRDQFMRHRGKVQFAQVNIPKQPPSLLAYFRCDIVGMALVPAFESGWAVGNVYIEPLAILIKMDAEGGFRHFFLDLFI